MIDFFRRNNSFHIPILVLLAFSLKLGYFGKSPEQSALGKKSPGGLLDPFLYNNFTQNLDPFFVNGVAVILLLFSAVYQNQVLTNRRMFQRSHMLTGLSVLLFTSLFPVEFELHPTIVLLPFTIFLYQQMTALQNAQMPLAVITNIGLLCGISSILYHPFWWMLPCSLVVLAQIRSFRWNEWILMILTFFTPFYFILTYQFLTDQWQPRSLFPAWGYPQMLKVPALPWIIAIAVSILWVGIGFFRWQSGKSRMLIQARKNWYILLTIGLFTLPTLFYPFGNTAEGLTLLSISAAPFAAHAFGEGKKKWPANLLLIMLLFTAGYMVWSVWGGNF
jgi:hypothetical protein